MLSKFPAESARSCVALSNAGSMAYGRALCGIKRDLLDASTGENVRAKWALSISATALLIFAPCNALAQEDARNVAVSERGQPEYDPLGLRFGGFNLNASVEVGAEHSTNLFAEENGQEDEDTYLTVRPEARLTSNWSRHEAHVAAGGAFREYQDFSSENASTGYLSGGGRVDIGRDTAVGAELRAAREVETRTDPDSPITLEPVEYDVRSAYGYVSHQFNRITVQLSAARTELDYHDAGDVNAIGFEQDYRDRTETGVTARAQYAITPRLSVVAQASSEDREYDVADVTPNSDGMTYLVGASFELSNLLRGELTVGQFERDYEATSAVPNVGEVSGTAVAGHVNWFVTPLTTVSFSASRDIQESSFENPYVQTHFGVRVDHELLRNVVLTGGVSMADNSYEGISRDDEFRTYDVGARYLMNRRISFAAAYVRNEATSDGADAYRSYDEDHVRLTVKFSL